MSPQDELARDNFALRLQAPLTLRPVKGRRPDRCVKVIQTTTGLDLNVTIQHTTMGWGVWLDKNPLTVFGQTGIGRDPTCFKTRLEAAIAAEKTRGLSRWNGSWQTPKPKVPKPDPKGYSDALQRLGKRDRVKLANNTYLEARGFQRPDGSWEGDIAVKLHSTDILTYHENGGYSIDHGGWQRRLTRERLERYLPPWIRIDGEIEYEAYRGGTRWPANWKVGVWKVRRGSNSGAEYIWHYFGRRVTIGPRLGVYVNQSDL